MKFAAAFDVEIVEGVQLPVVYEFPDEQSARAWITAMQPVAGVEILLVSFAYSDYTVLASGLDIISDDETETRRHV